MNVYIFKPTVILSLNVFFPPLFAATIDVKRNIFDLCTDTKDCYLAVIEVNSFSLHF